MTHLKAVRLSPSDPHSALRRPGRPMPARYAAPRHLTEQQLTNPLIRTAYHRLSNMTSYRGQYLRRLDRVHGDRRTRLEKFVAIEQVAEQLLIRLDLATSVLGYIDPKNGRYVLNTQRGIAEDAGISAPALCRLLKTFDDAGYVYRRIERVRLDEKDENGLHLVRTRVLVRFTKLFWKDLGLGYVQERVQHSAKKKRDAVLRDIGQKRLSDMEQHSKELHRREVSRQRWQAKEAREAAGNAVNPQGHSSPPDPRSKRAQSQTGARKAGGDLQSMVDKLMNSVANKAK